MQKDNPACYECPKRKHELHTWSPIMQDSIMIGAYCLHCDLKLTEEQANDVWRE